MVLTLLFQDGLDCCVFQTIGGATRVVWRHVFPSYAAFFVGVFDHSGVLLICLSVRRMIMWMRKRHQSLSQDWGEW